MSFPDDDDRNGLGRPPRSLRVRREQMQLALMARLRAYFLAGILVTAPIGITIYLAWLLVSFIDARVTALLPARFNPETYLPFAIPGLGVVVVVVALVLIGAFTAGLFGRLLTGFFDAALARMPVLRSVYAALKQLVETVLAQKSGAFRQAVLLEYPRRGIWTIGLLTGVTEGEVQTISGGDVVNVFVPTTPNPTSGFLLFVPRADVVPLAMSVEDALKMIVSGGIVTPPNGPPP
ncbi:MAG TPA: DUF502 domain-containing protein, partial [Rhodospirillales bacterium]|nr:DUF502 domain-containing protein [Rhodospirillales bacterium]